MWTMVNVQIDPDREPTAAQREGAREMRSMYVALVREGFTENQALQIIGQILAAAIAKGPK